MKDLELLPVNKGPKIYVFLIGNKAVKNPIVSDYTNTLCTISKSIHNLKQKQNHQILLYLRLNILTITLCHELHINNC